MKQAKIIPANPDKSGYWYFLDVYKRQVLGRTVAFEQNQQTYQGLAKDISDTGQLLVQLENQEDIWLNSGEISLKQWDL